MKRPGVGIDFAIAAFMTGLFKVTLVLMAVELLLIAPIKKTSADGVKPKAEFYITIDWGTDRDTDIDIWIKDVGNNEIIWFNRKEGTYVTLDRDVLGDFNNMVAGINGKISRVNEEMVTIRSLANDEYIVNAVLYSDHGHADGAAVEPVPFTIRLVKLNPVMKVVTEVSGVANYIKQEVHVFRFSVEGGEVSDVNSDRPEYIMSAK